jgi:hypothetical protein
MKAGWQDKFIRALARTGNVSVAAKAARISRSQAYEHRQADSEFAKRWDEANQEAGDALEEEARQRAVVGRLRPVYQGGIKVGEIREYSDGLLTLLLKANRPAKFRENHRVEHTGAGGGPIAIREVVVERAAAADESEGGPETLEG